MGYETRELTLNEALDELREARRSLAKLQAEGASSIYERTAQGRVDRAERAIVQAVERGAVPKPIDVVAAVRRRPDGRVWLCKRNSDGAHAGLAGMWEYPGGKVEPNEQLREALVRELSEEFVFLSSGHIHPGRVLDSIDSAYGVVVYRVTFFEVDMSEPVGLRKHTEARWMTPEEACSVEHLPSGTIFNARHLARRQQQRDELPDIEAVRHAFMAGRRELLAQGEPSDDGEGAFQHYLRTIRPALV